MMRFVNLLAASCLVASAAIAPAECSWRLGWPSDQRIWAVPWGSAPPGDFLTRMECERAIDTMLGEAIRGQALLIELPACVCIPGYDNFAQEGIRHSHHDTSGGDGTRSDFAPPWRQVVPVGQSVVEPHLDRRLAVVA